MVSQWSKFNLYRTAFEDEPVLVSTPFTPASTLDGLVYFLPTREEDGIQVCMALDQDVWAELDTDGPVHFLLTRGDHDILDCMGLD